jgi:AcrR family transcriptional regulator
MARKLGLTLDDVVSAAAAVADTDGIEALSLAAVAERVRVRPPSLYHHVAGVAGLRRHLALLGAARLEEAIAAAARGRAGRRALVAAARAYRLFARRHPGLLAATLPAPRPGEDDELYRALARPVATIAGILAGLGVEEDDAIHVIRALRSYLHGFIELERRGGFGMPQKLETSFERGLALLVDSIGREKQ